MRAAGSLAEDLADANEMRDAPMMRMPASLPFAKRVMVGERLGRLLSFSIVLLRHCPGIGQSPSPSRAAEPRMRLLGCCGEWA